MLAELANLNLCASPFLRRAGSNLCWYNTVVSHIYAYDRAKTLSFILLIRHKSTEFENESNV